MHQEFEVTADLFTECTNLRSLYLSRTTYQKSATPHFADCNTWIARITTLRRWPPFYLILSDSVQTDRIIKCPRKRTSTWLTTRYNFSASNYVTRRTPILKFLTQRTNLCHSMYVETIWTRWVPHQWGGWNIQQLLRTCQEIRGSVRVLLQVKFGRNWDTNWRWIVRLQKTGRDVLGTWQKKTCRPVDIYL